MKKFIYGVVAMFALVAVSCGTKTTENVEATNDSLATDSVECVCDSVCTCDSTDLCPAECVTEGDSTVEAE